MTCWRSFQEAPACLASATCSSTACGLLNNVQKLRLNYLSARATLTSLRHEPSGKTSRMGTTFSSTTEHDEAPRPRLPSIRESSLEEEPEIVHTVGSQELTVPVVKNGEQPYHEEQDKRVFYFYLLHHAYAALAMACDTRAAAQRYAAHPLPKCPAADPHSRLPPRPCRTLPSSSARAPPSNCMPCMQPDMHSAAHTDGH